MIAAYLMIHAFLYLKSTAAAY